MTAFYISRNQVASLVLLILFSSFARAFMPPYESYFKEKAQRTELNERSADDSLHDSHQKIKDDLSDCQSLVAALGTSILEQPVDSEDGETVCAENRKTARELIRVQRLYSETQALLEAAHAKWLESQTEMESLREELRHAQAEISQAGQEKDALDEKIILLERQIIKEKETSKIFVEESRREIEAEYNRIYRWQEQRNWDLASSKAQLEKHITEKETQLEAAKTELLISRYDLLNANERLRSLEHNRYNEYLRVSLSHIVASLDAIKDYVRENVPFDWLESLLDLLRTNVSPWWHFCIHHCKIFLKDILPPDVVFYQNQLMLITCETFDLVSIFCKLQAAPTSIVLLSRMLKDHCRDAVICLELGLMIIAFVFVIQLLQSLFRSRKAVTITKRV
jgi:hypothetical protein